MDEKLYPQKVVCDVQMSERNAISAPPPVTPRRRHFWEKLGWYNMAVLVLGTAAIGLALVFLIFFWAISRDAINQRSVPKVWSRIVEDENTQSVITSCSVLIRVATSAQLGVFAAMMAALILERVGVRGEELPHVSMIRCSNSGPHSLASTIFMSTFTKPTLPCAVLVLIAVLNAVSLQFTSTILLQDLGNVNVILKTQTNLIPFGLKDPSSTEPTAGVDYWKTGPSTYNRFAEYKEARSEGPTFFDTGRTFRGFLPFSKSEERTNTRSYSGPMTVVDMRVVCVKPTISNISVNVGDGAEIPPSILAMYDWKGAHPDIVNGDQLTKEVNCTIATSDWVLGKPYWPMTLCDAGTGHARLRGGIKPDNEPTSKTGHTSTYLLINATGDMHDWTNSVSEESPLEQKDLPHSRWASLRRGDISLDVSVCFVNPQPDNYIIDVFSHRDQADAILTVDPNNAIYNTTLIRNLLDATKNELSQEKRGVLKFKEVANWTAARWKLIHNETSKNYIWDAQVRLSKESTKDGDLAECSIFSAASPANAAVHRSHAALFQQAIQQTENPAVALQALWTTLSSMVYYDYIPEYNLRGKAYFELSSSVRIPERWYALGAILGLLALHFSLILIALFLFLRKTEMSLLGNAWQVVSQVMSTDTAEAFHRATTQTDGEIKGSLNKEGDAGQTIRITKSMSNGRMEATAIRHHPRGTGQSAGSNCSAAIWNERVSLFPNTTEEYRRLVDKNRRFGESCRSQSGRLIQYLDTISSPKDHEAVRAALGPGEKMNWLGLSYGTRLGAEYAQLFPNNVRAMVLDGVLKRSQAESSDILVENTAYSTGLQAFFDWANTSAHSAIRGQDDRALWLGLIESSTKSPLPALGCDNIACRKEVTAEDILFSGQEFLKDWRAFATAVLEASKGNATLFASGLASESNPGAYSSLTIGCHEFKPSASTYEDFQAKKRIGDIFSPLTRGASQAWYFQASCVGWPVPARSPAKRLNIQTQNPILLVNAIRDQSTSYTWAVGMLQEIRNHFLLTRNGDGHTSYTRGGNATEAIHDYLIGLKLPSPGTVLDS